MKLFTYIDRLTRFDRWGPRANPLIRLTLQRETRLSLRSALWLAFGIGLAGLALSTWQIMHTTTDNLADLEWILVVFGWVFVVATPFGVAFSAALNTRRAIVPERFELVQITTLCNEDVVWALIFEALHGLRYALIGLVGIMPLLVIKVFHWRMVFELQYQNRFRGYYGGQNYAAPSASEIIMPTLLALGLLLAVWGLTLLGAAVGVRSALLSRRTEMAIAVAPFSVLMTVFGQCMCTTLASFAFNDADLIGVVVYALILLVLVVVAPYLLVLNVVWTTADRWDR
ncbi:MAG: hypothetical protein JXA10_18970 [Anaerolineae bacterium]|nr:hypothetical protein [Anaerolineae bacterium]